MIPLGLKETKEIDFRDPFKDFILEHYSEDANKYENAIADFMDTRQVLQTQTYATGNINCWSIFTVYGFTPRKLFTYAFKLMKNFIWPL